MSVIFYCDKGYSSDFPVYELKVRVSPEKHSIEGRAIITVPEGIKAHILSGGLTIKGLRINGIEQEPDTNDSLKKIEDYTGKKVIEIQYSGLFQSGTPRENIQNAGVTGTNAIDVSGVMLLSGWYPELSVPCIYQLTVDIPPDYDAISESDSEIVTLNDTIKTVTFNFPHPVPGITLVAGRYHVIEEDFHGISLKTYFFKNNAELTEKYINHTKEYIEFYENLIGPFPYKTFSVVENTFQTGYSFPTFTLLGSRVLRLPFILKTSLGHEILHQWLGCYVFVDYEKGNWSEGLTTYLADHWHRLNEGKGAQYRKKILLDYTNYVDPEDEITLKDFKSRKDFSTRTIGYGKTAMVFHMLRKMLGDDAFFEGVRKFVSEHKYRKVSWDEIKKAFTPTQIEKHRLEQFFDNWTNKKGTPSLKIGDPLIVFRDGLYTLALDIEQEQDGDPFIVNLPVRVLRADGEDRIVITVDKKNVHYEKNFSDRPLQIVIDEEYDIMRRLTEAEIPPVISAFTGRKESVVFVPPDYRDEYKDVAEFFKNQGYAVKEQITSSDLNEHSILILSTKNRLYDRLFAGRTLPGGGFAVKVYKNPFNSKRVVVVFQARNQEELNSAFKKIVRYGNYSFLQFEKGNNISKRIDKADNGIIIDLRMPVEAIETKSTIGLDEVVRRTKNSRVIFIGEVHDQYAHHVMQYEIIRRLYKEKRKLVIGLEMFQRPFQRYLDQYINGDIGEGEFLKKTEYFKRWGYNYNLYRDILHFARANRIPVIALNLRKELIKKVSGEGIDSLTEEEYAEIPGDIDMTNREYSESMKEVFSHHSSSQNKGFENFFQAQILWDETMAHAISEAMEKYPDMQMVVLAGNGHLRYSWGIPDRVRRLTNESGVIILNGGEEKINRELADFVLYPEPVKAPESPKLKVILEEKDNLVTVKEVMKGGPAEQAGLKADDIIHKIDDREIEDISDIKIVLLDKRHGDPIKMIIYRKRFILGAEEIELDVTL